MTVMKKGNFSIDIGFLKLGVILRKVIGNARGSCIPNSRRELLLLENPKIVIAPIFQGKFMLKAFHRYTRFSAKHERSCASFLSAPPM